MARASRAGTIPRPETIEEVIAHAEQRGQRVTGWQRHVLQYWVETIGNTPATEAAGIIKPDGRTYVQLGKFPILCDCIECDEPSLIFPADKAHPHTFEQSGYVICPVCSWGMSDQQLSLLECPPVSAQDGST